MPVKGIQQVRVGRSQEKGFKLWTVRENCRKGVPDKGNLNRERAVSKALSLHKKQLFSSELQWRVRDGVYTERHEDRVPSKKRKTKVAVLKTIPSLTGSQWSALSSGLTCSCPLLRKTTFTAWFWTLCSLQSDHSWCQWAKCCSSPTDWEQKKASAEQWLLSSGDDGWSYFCYFFWSRDNLNDWCGQCASP